MNDLIKKFIQFSLGNLIVLLLGFITAPITTRMISPEQMGIFSVFNVLSNLLLFFVLVGADQSYVRYYYDEEKESRGSLFIKCITISFIATIVLSVIILFFYKEVSIYLISEKSFFLAVLLMLNLIFSVISRFSLLQVRMSQKANLYSSLNIILKILSLLLFLIFFNVYNNSYLTLILSLIISTAIVAFLGIIFERKEIFAQKSIKVVKITSKEIIKYGVPFIFSTAIIWVFQSIDKICIKEFVGYSEVGLYSGAMNFIVLLNTCQVTFTTFWVPIAYEQYSNNPNNKNFFIKVNKIVSALMLLSAIILISFKDIIVILLGEQYRQAAFIFPYLVFMPIMYTISETTVLGINFEKKTTKHIYIAIISALTNLLLNLLLVPKLGAKGAAISTGISYIVFFIVRTYISNKYYKINFKLCRFFICTLLIYAFATFSSFYKFNFNILIQMCICLITLFILYRDAFIEMYKLIKLNFKRQ